MKFTRSIYRSVFNGNGIARRLAVAVILFSSAITLVTTLLQLYGQYDRQIDEIHRVLGEIEQSQLPLLVDSVWSADAAQVDLHVSGLVKRRDIVGAVVTTPDGLRWRAGTETPRYPIVAGFPLRRYYRGEDIGIGKLTVIASRDAVLWRIGDMLMHELVSNAIKTFLVAIFILLTFQLLVTRHLHDLAEYTKIFAFLDSDARPLRLDRAPDGWGRPDALDRISEALNLARASLVEAQTELRRSERDYRAIFDHVPVGLLRLDDKGGLMRANGAFWQMAGFEAGGSASALPGSIFDLADAGAERDRLREGLATGVPRLSQDLRLARPDGAVVPVHLEALRMADPEGSYEASVSDLSDRLASEAKLRRALEVAEVGNREKSQFLARVSHELRTPLNAVIGFSYLISAASEDKVAERYRDYGQDIHGAGEHLLRLIDDLIDIARIEAGQLELREEEVDIGAVIAEIAALMQAQIAEVGVRLDCDDRTGGCRLLGDPTRIKQILINLVGNAVKFSPAGEAIVLRAFLDGERRLHVEVEDHGIGIRPSDRERVFEPFVQVEDAYVRGNPGAGIGLSLVRSFTLLHGGSIGIDDAPGGGALIAIVFPASRTLRAEA